MKKTVYLLAVVFALAIPSIVCAQAVTANALLDEAASGSAAVGPALPAPLPPIYPPNPEVATSGTLSTQSSQNWSTAPWVPGPFPDGGGTAQFDPILNITGTVPTAPTITLDVTPTLSGLTYNSTISYLLAASGANTLNLTTTGTNTFNAQLTAMNTISFFSLANGISAPISGGGAFGLTKTGVGTITLTGTNTYTGGTHIDQGILFISGAAGDATLGAAGVGNDISFNGGTLGTNITGGWTTSRNIFLDAGGGSIIPVSAATINGVISGAGSFTTRDFTAAVTLTANNTYTGATNTITLGSTLALSGNGSINQSSSYDLAGTLALSNTATNNNQRLSATAPITVHEGFFTLSGNAGAATTESDGALTLGNGITKIAVTPNGAQPASWTFSGITRQNNSVIDLTGTSLGATPAVNVAQIISTASPGTLIGGGGGAGSTNISILPWAIGNTTAAATNGSSFVTWNSGDGTFRPLASGEYSTLTSGASTTDNTNVAAATAISAPTTVNSVRINGTGTLLTGTGGLNITSGALLYSPTASTTAGIISANINFGTAEGVVVSTAGTANSFTPGLTLSGVISGSGGLTLNPILNPTLAAGPASGGSITVSGANTYTGTTTLHGFTNFSGTVANDGATPGPFGLDTSAIVIDSANGITGLAATAAATMNRNLSVIGGPTSSGSQLLTSGAFTFTVNGNINLQSALTFQGATGTFAINGNVTGTGYLSDLSTPIIVLNGTNNYSGGTNIGTGTYSVGNNSAFGTGTIFFSGAGGRIQSSDATAHTIGNNFLIGSTLSGTAANNPTFQGTGDLNFTGNLNLNGSRGLNVINTGNTTFSGPVMNGAITKFGTGALTFSGVNNPFSGGITSNGGTINANAVGTLGTGALNLNNAAAIANINANQSIAGLVGVGSSTLNIATGVNLTLNVPGTVTYSGIIAALGSLTKTGAGQQTLQTSTTNSYSGGTFVNAGTLTFNQDTSLGTGAVTLGTAGGGNATLVTTTNNSPANNIIVASTAAPAAGTLTLGSTSTAASGGTYSGLITLNQNVNLTSQNTGATTGLRFTGNITGAGGINKVQTGVAVLNPTAGVNDYAGGTSISAGQLTVRKDSALGTGNVSLLAGGVTLLLQDGATNNYISDNATLSIISGAAANLNFSGTDTVGGLILDGTTQTDFGATYGFTGSGATHQFNDFFLGTGTVTLIPEPSTWVMTIVGASLLMGAQRFRRRTR